jgi:TonB family protein
VDVVLGGNGQLETIRIARGSGSDPIDLCVVDAFRIAGPFPNPPAQLVEKDGRVYMPDFEFTLQVGHAGLQYQGIDPRAGVQFPGILKSPR